MEDLSKADSKNMTQAEDLIMTSQGYATCPALEVLRENNGVYRFKLEGADKTLFYFGAPHSNDPKNPLFEKIKEDFIAIQPDMVLVEGCENLTNTLERKKQTITHAGRENDIENIIRTHGEPLFTLKLAVDAGIDFESPEPDFKEELASLQTQGFEPESIFAYYVDRKSTRLNSSH